MHGLQSNNESLEGSPGILIPLDTLSRQLSGLASLFPCFAQRRAYLNDRALARSPAPLLMAIAPPKVIQV